MGRRTGETRIEVMVTPTESKLLKSEAENAGLSLSNYIRRLIHLPEREAGGARKGGFEPGNQHAVKKKRKKKS